VAHEEGQPPDFGDYTAAEMGFPVPSPSPGGMPPGDGGASVPHFFTFASLVRSASRAYLAQFDEALRNSPENARAMRRDPILMGALRRRQRPTAQLSWHVTPKDETDPAETEAAALVTKVLEAIPRFQKMKMSLLEAVWYGKYAVEIEYEWKEYLDKQVLFVRDFIPINGDKLRFRWDGVPGVLVYAGYPGPKDAVDFGYVHWLSSEDRQQYVIHEHEPEDADWWEPEMGGAIHGVGVRGRLYWFWWMKQQVFALLMNYLARFANGFTIFYYQAGNPQAKQEAIAAAKAQFTSHALIYPRWPSENPDVNSVQRMEVGTASPMLLWNLTNDYFDDVMERFIEGQTLSTKAEGGGMGDGTATQHGETLDEIVKYDAVDLADTFQRDLVDVLYAYNCPGVEPGKFEFEIDSPNSAELMEYGEQLFEWGVPLDEDQAYKISQWSKPKPGSGIVSKLGTMQPAALGGVQGVPVAGEAGPPSQDVAAGTPPMQSAVPQGEGSPTPYQRNGYNNGTNLRTRGGISILPRRRVVVAR
jgi:hypothetical protein